METTRVKGILTLVLSVFTLLGCSRNAPKTSTAIQQTETPEIENTSEVDSLTVIPQTENPEQIAHTIEVDRSKEQEEIQNLIRKTLKWAASKERIELLPMLTDEEERIYTGFDLVRHRSNLDILRATGFCAEEFIENYDRIILTLDRKMKNREFEEWFVGDLPTFRFASNSDPWCKCQDVPYDDPDPWDHVEIEVLELNGDRARLVWRWGGADLDIDSGWRSHAYAFRTVKENGKWKIAFMQEFDFEKSTRS